MSDKTCSPFAEPDKTSPSIQISDRTLLRFPAPDKTMVPFNAVTEPQGALTISTKRFR